MQTMLLTPCSSSYHLYFPPKSFLSFPKILGNYSRAGVVQMCLPGPTKDTQNSGQHKIPLSYSSYKWCAGLSGLGFLETTYLTYLKFSNSEPFCPVAAASCSDVLNSDYAIIFGVPLPLIGMFAYGLVFLLGLKLGGWDVPFKVNQSEGRLLLLPISASMAAASAFFLYTLAIRLDGASCSYCLASAILSFSLFFIVLKDFGLQELQKNFTLPLFTAAIVLAVLNTSYSSLPPVLPSSTAIDLPYYATEVISGSSPYAISLAQHLKSIGARMYGAFWCTHCQEQKEFLGREAMKIIDYAECFPDGVKKGVKMDSACTVAGIEGFPTWIIKGKTYSGEKTLEELAEISGFQVDEVAQSN